MSFNMLSPSPCVCMCNLNMYIYLTVIKKEVMKLRGVRRLKRSWEEREGWEKNDVNTPLMYEILKKLNKKLF